MAPGGDREVITVSDANALAKAAADRFLARIAANGDRVSVCLTGGSSPKQLYQLLATDPYRSRIPWHRVHWFIGDERLVPPNDPLNNMSMARHLFLDRFAPAANIHPIPTDTVVDPGEAALRYENELQSFYGADVLDPSRPLFDVVLMGVGPDGHTASLFPGYPAIEETERWVIGVPRAHVEPFVPRVTLTLPALGSCREMVFAGENLPANRAHSIGETVWLVDKAALPESFRGQ
jgi:6-phosphogluconolactonase